MDLSGPVQIDVLTNFSRGGTGQDICGPNRYRIIQAQALH